MNKAFVKEQDTDASHCPRCTSLGRPVGAKTLDALLVPDARDQVSRTAMYCPFDGCQVAYFDSFDRVVMIDKLVRPIYPKDPAAPICPCFGLTFQDIQADIDEGVVTRTRETVLKAKTADARCAELSPCGESCVPDIQRCYRLLRGPENSANTGR